MDLDDNNIKLNIEMAFIDACHSFESTYKDFLNIRKHMVNDGIIFMHDMYPKDIESTDSKLSGDCYKTAEKIRKEHFNDFEIITIPVEPGLSILRKVDRQLDWIKEDDKENKKETFGFIITSYIHEFNHLLALDSCIKSLRDKHLEQKKIIIIDTKSNKNLVNLAINSNKYDDVIFEFSKEDIPADMLALYYYKKNKYFTKAIIIQDSMKLKEKIDVSNVNDVLYLWHFTNHRIHWNTIKEPDTEYNKTNNIVTHDDLIIDRINSKIEIQEFKDYCNSIYFRKDKWCGCFGGCCIISYDFLEELDRRTGIINFQKLMITRRDRMVFESLFSIACQYVSGRDMEVSYDGLYKGLEGNIISKVSFER